MTATDPAGRELQDLALAIEAESELPRDAFARELEARVSEGFPRARRFPRALPLPGSPRLAVPRWLGRRGLALAGAAATLLLVIGVALTQSGDETISDPNSADQRPTAVESQDSAPPAPSAASEPGGGAAQGSGDSGAGSGRRVAPGERERRIERSAELELTAPGDELEPVADSILRVTDRHRGFVLRSSVATGEDSEGGDFELRIPAESLQAALADLSKLGHVRSRRQAGRDITDVYVSSRDRLDTARAERRSLLRRLAGADTDAEAERLRRRLDAVSLRIERLRRELGALRERTDYAAVSVDLEADDGQGGGGGGGGGTGDALDDALGMLAGSLNLALRALGVLIPLAIVGGLGWLAGRILLRRRREAALR